MQVISGNKYYSKHIFRCFHHFQDRLMQRYKMSITIDEYINLSKSYDYKLLQVKDSNKRREILIKFKGRDIRAVKQSESEGFLLITTFIRA